MDKLDIALKLGNEILNAKLQNKLADYIPYGLSPDDPSDWQLRFHSLGATKYQRLLCAALRIGKSYSGCAEDAYHLTGKYPDWWTGARFDRPVKLWASGISNEKTRDALQAFLFGPPNDPSAFGTGMIPKNCLDYDRAIRKAQVPNAFQSVPVKHVSGRWSNCVLKAYEQKAKAFMSEEVDVIHLDEEPKRDIMSQCLVRGKLLYLTFTPELGMTEVVSQFFNDIKDDYQALIQAGWDDAPHLTEDWKEARLATLLPFERDAKTKGIPTFGEGLIFPIDDDEIKCSPFPIPDHYGVLAGMDFGGWNHPTACAWIAHDTDTDIIYIYAAYKSKLRQTAEHASAIRAKGNDIEIHYPHDAEKADRGGTKLAQLYRNEKVKMFHTHFTNPPADGEKEGQGGNAVSPGLVEMMLRMQTGRLKVFSNLEDWFKEKRIYHTVDGKIIRKGEDLMSATRYA
ncbi:hypothetical protein LCGC14_1495560, partial [marine sediment metagenome]